MWNVCEHRDRINANLISPMGYVPVVTRPKMFSSLVRPTYGWLSEHLRLIIMSMLFRPDNQKVTGKVIRPLSHFLLLIIYNHPHTFHSGLARFLLAVFTSVLSMTILQLRNLNFGGFWCWVNKLNGFTIPVGSSTNSSTNISKYILGHLNLVSSILQNKTLNCYSVICHNY